jgi:hypothetical protein
MHSTFRPIRPSPPSPRFGSPRNDGVMRGGRKVEVQFSTAVSSSHTPLVPGWAGVPALGILSHGPKFLPARWPGTD